MIIEGEKRTYVSFNDGEILKKSSKTSYFQSFYPPTKWNRPTWQMKSH